MWSGGDAPPLILPRSRAVVHSWPRRPRFGWRARVFLLSAQRDLHGQVARTCVRTGMARQSNLAVFEHAPRRAPAWREAAEDLRETALRARLVFELAAMDILERYRGSVLGPFWLTLSTLVLIAALGVVYSRLFGLELAVYLPWLATSLVLWTLINATVQEGCAAFSGQEGLIRSVRLPQGVHVARVVLRNVMVFAHNLPIVVATLWIFGAELTLATLLILPGLLVLLLLLFAVVLGLALVCARFRDIPPVVGSALQVLFFVTPIMWQPSLLGDAAAWLWLNPLHPVLEILREPLLGRTPSVAAWLVSGVWALLAWVGAFALFARYRARIAFWV